MIFKLEKGYLASLDILVDIINVDESNDTISFADNYDTDYSFNIPHKLYTDMNEIINIVIEKFKEYDYNAEFKNNILIFDTPIRINKNEFTDFIGLVTSDVLFDEMEREYIKEYTITKNIVPVPTEFYIFLSTIPKITNTTYTDAILTLGNLSVGQQSIQINFQNDYDDLYLLISSNVNKYPIKYNNSATLLII